MRDASKPRSKGGAASGYAGTTMRTRMMGLNQKRRRRSCLAGLAGAWRRGTLAGRSWTLRRKMKMMEITMRAWSRKNRRQSTKRMTLPQAKSSRCLAMY